MVPTRKEKIMLVAASIFQRVGFEKTSMADVAREAGVARQTVYNLFKDKDDLFRSYMTYALDQQRAELQTAWDTASDFNQVYDAFIEKVVFVWFDKTAAFPDVAASRQTIHLLAEDLLSDFATDVIAGIEARLPQKAGFEEGAAMTRRGFAEFMYWSAVNAKFDAPDRAALERRIATGRVLAFSYLDGLSTADHAA